MSAALIARNADLARLRDEGYFVAIKGSSLLVRDVPYVTQKQEVKRGILVCPLDLAGDNTIRPGDHQVQFIGERPCNKDGSPMTKLIGSEINNEIAPGLVARFSFSHKPACGYYADYYEKMTAYATILAAQATWLEPGADARANRVVEPEPDEDTPFHYLDTASSRAGINGATAKLKLRKVVIAGVGGTGSYVLDPVAKAPVASIHLVDGDVYNTHNAFRSPGAPSIEELRAQPFKVDYFKAIYDKMHKGIVAHPEHINESNAEKHLRDADLVFVCVDDGRSKAFIIRKLQEYGVPFIDVGMGLVEKDSQLSGILRVTTSTPQQRGAHRRIPCSEADPENEYDRNIQIPDLNMLNAALAVIKWKKLFGFYADNEGEHFSTYSIDTNLLTSDET
ncbi:ThiF family adenylyltransferase [Bradyrhizobium sp. SZCCHNRI20481]|uniref:ThiF family adenylyltransferase n=1 Tax=Bradyrhizobium sp. SZCCHNRI20481 TaxID=3057286 RepID=UPI002916CA9F|nr:ThiF family adenylyltransferase [Bradyrhizobium sp. SZCCHNRI20481]